MVSGTTALLGFGLFTSVLTKNVSADKKLPRYAKCEGGEKIEHISHGISEYVSSDQAEVDLGGGCALCLACAACAICAICFVCALCVACVIPFIVAIALTGAASAATVAATTSSATAATGAAVAIGVSG